MASRRPVSATSALQTRQINTADEDQRPQVCRKPLQSAKERLKSMRKPVNVPTSHPSIDLLSPSNLRSAKASSALNNAVGPFDEAENVAPTARNKTVDSRNRKGQELYTGFLGRLGYTTSRRQPNRPGAGAGGRGGGGVSRVSEVPTVAKRRLTMGGDVNGGGKTGQVKSGDGGRIMVYVRVRPLSNKERDAKAVSCIKIVDEKTVFISEALDDMDYLRLKRKCGRYFRFDGVFPETSSQEDVYSTTTSDLVESVLEGRNGSVFCYGATGAGKTYTMLGTFGQPGVMFQALKHLFTRIRQCSENGEHQVHLSYLEVYNENIYDLLSPGRNLHVREDEQGVSVVGLSTYQAYSTEQVMQVLQKGNENRTTEPTIQNDTSSRSHAILQVITEYKMKEGSTTICRKGKLSLIDLAGSERALATENRSIRSQEGANINRSLLALSSCISALVERKTHVPFRNSKLTQLLKDSLGGACNTVMIANVSPSDQTYEQTQTTLYWADRAKEIRTKAGIANVERQIPEDETDKVKLLRDLQKENEKLRKQVVDYKHKAMILQNQVLAAENTEPEPIDIELPNVESKTPNSASKSRLSELPISKTPHLHSAHSKKRLSSDQNNPEDLSRNRKITAMEREMQQMGRQFALKEHEYIVTIDNLQHKHHAAIVQLQSQHQETILNMQREHALQLKQKDEFIHELCKQCNANSKPRVPIVPLPNKNATISLSPQTNLSRGKVSTLPSSTANSPSNPPEKKRSIGLQKPPKPIENTGTARMENNFETDTVGSLDSRNPTTAYRFSADVDGSRTKKRTFDDIKNGNVLSSHQPSRTTRSGRNLNASSRLLQPGFARFEPRVFERGKLG